MQALRLNEHYVSVQGEGPHIGEMTQFIRFSGCNMRCPGWPCDTQFAIQPSLWKDDPKVQPDDIIERALQIRTSTGAARVCLTGGEPFMQQKDLLHKLFMDLISHDFKIDVFSNGSYIYPSWAFDRHVTFVMDWKLPGSGEGQTKLEERMINARQLRTTDCIKFVVKDRSDLEVADIISTDWMEGEGQVQAKIFVGRVWGQITDQEIIEYLQEHELPWLLNVQVHKYIWHPDVRGV
jgi:7-carboxy-7-deazaguanine synthase